MNDELMAADGTARGYFDAVAGHVECVGVFHLLDAPCHVFAVLLFLFLRNDQAFSVTL